MVALALTGDVMLGRMVDRLVWGDPSLDPAYVWGDTRPLLLAHDLRLINLECVVAERCDDAHRAAKVFTFGARPRAIEALTAARVDFVSLANNHVLDFGSEALLQLLELLDRQGIAHAGAGRTREEALRPAILRAGPPGPAGGLTVGVLGLTDNEPEWEAGSATPGVAFVDHNRRGLKEPYRTRIRRALAATRAEADLVVVSAHVGPNWGEPSPEARALAHQVLDLGADLYWGHSNHAPRGIELYGGRPILYSTGDFVDDYAVHPAERNDLSFLFGAEVEERRIRRLRLYPVKIGRLQVNRAPEDEAAWLRARMAERCARFGATFTETAGVLTLDFP